MVYQWAFLQTALSLTLACGAVSAWADMEYTPEDLPLAQHIGHTSVLPDSPLQVGTVLLRRTEEALPPPSQVELEEKLRRLSEEAAQMAAQTEVQKMRDQVSKLSERTDAVLGQAKSEMDSAENRITALAQHTAAQTSAVLQAQTEAQQTALASLNHQLEFLQAQQTRLGEDAREYARLQAETAKVTAQRDALIYAQDQAQLAENRLRQDTDLKLKNQRDIAASRMMLIDQQLQSQKSLTETRLSALEKMTDSNRELAALNMKLVASELRTYADAQFAGLAASTSATLAKLDQSTRGDLAQVRKETELHLGTVLAKAQLQARQLAEEKSALMASRIANLQTQLKAQKFTPEQIQAIAAQTVHNAQPEMRALALDAMRDSQDYIKTVARGVIQSKDPAVAAALGDALKDIVVKDDKVVFAMRKALEAQKTAGLASPTTRLGNGWNDPSVLAALPTPQVVSGTLADAYLAGLAPAAGELPDTALAAQKRDLSAISIQRAHNRTDLGDLRKYRVVIHDDNKTLENMLTDILHRAEPMVGPWQIRWKISEDNKDILSEKFSLDAETTFDEFVSYIAQYMGNERGIKLSFSLFDAERIIVVSD